ncbi:MAG: hypothetical protein U9M92_00395 [Patescibacteria group bacterium]|nr:hypothetical protein [Patescibacteria group bacterium]
MFLLSSPLYYLWWHYTTAWRDGAIIWSNLLRFIYHFFSLPILVRTWVAPWRRLGEAYKPGLHPGEWASSLVVNLLMRIVGALARTILIISGLCSLVLMVLMGIIGALVWLLMPLIVVVLLIIALNCIF